MNIKKKNIEEYSDIIEKIVLCIDYLKNNNDKAFKIIKKNPFKKIKKIQIQKNVLDNIPIEEILMTSLAKAEDSSRNGQRILGILQAFYYFYPLLNNFGNGNHGFYIKDMYRNIKKVVDKIEKE